MRGVKPISDVGLGLAVDDGVFYTEKGVTWDQLKAKVPELPDAEGRLREIRADENPAEIFERATDHMASSGLFRNGDGTKGMYQERNPGGGFNGLMFGASYVKAAGMPPLAAAFALGAPGGTYDESAQYLMRLAEDNGVDVSCCLTLPGYTPRTVAVVRVIDDHQMQRTFIHDPGVSRTATASDYIQKLKGIKAGAATIYYVNIAEALCANGGRGLGELASYLQKNGTLTVVDAAGDKGKMVRTGFGGFFGSGCLQHIDIFAPGEEEAGAITGMRYFRDMADALLVEGGDGKALMLSRINREQLQAAWDNYSDMRGPGVVIIKRGTAGNVLYTGSQDNLRHVAVLSGDYKAHRNPIDNWKHQQVVTPAFSVPVSKSVGTGDKSVMGAVLHALAGKANNPAELSIALSAAGAIAAAGQELTPASLERMIAEGNPFYS